MSDLKVTSTGVHRIQGFKEFKNCLGGREIEVIWHLLKQLGGTAIVKLFRNLDEIQAVKISCYYDDTRQGHLLIAEQIKPKHYVGTATKDPETGEFISNGDWSPVY